MSGNLTTEAGALLSLRHAVTHYAQRVRDAMNDARRDADALVKRAEDATRRRTNDLNRALADVQQAKARLSACHDERHAATLRAEVAALARLADERKQLLGYAQKAVQAAREAQSNLVKILQAMDATVGENNSVATKALDNISRKLDEIGYESPLARAGHVANRTLAVVEMAGAISGLGRELTPPQVLPPPERSVVSQQVKEDAASEPILQYAHYKITEGEKHGGDVPRLPGTGSGS